MASKTSTDTVLVCRACFTSDATNFALLTQKCMEPGKHHRGDRVEVCWSGSFRDGRACEVRPTPENVMVRKFHICPLLPDCKKGKRCTFAHNEMECVIWNKRKQSRSSTFYVFLI